MTTVADPSDVAVGGQSSQGDDLRSAPELPREDLGAPLRTTRTAAEISCTGTPVSESSFAANGSGSYKSVTLSKPGLYQYQEVAPADANHIGFTTPCNAVSERVRVRADRPCTPSSARRPLPPGRRSRTP
jgi:hypothetical protein